MERDGRGELDRLRSFVEGEIPGDSTVWAYVRYTFSILEIHKLLDITVHLRITHRGDHDQLWDGRDTEILRFRVQDPSEALEMLVACPALTNLSLSLIPFEEGQLVPYWPVHQVNPLVLQLFAVVRTSRSLTTLVILFKVEARLIRRCEYLSEPVAWHSVSLDTYHERFFHEDLPILLRDNPLFEKLTFYLKWTDDYPQSYLAYCFTRNPNLNSCALTISHYSKSINHCCLPLVGVVRLFMPVVQGEPLNVEVLRELVIETNPLDRRCGHCRDAIANMVCRNSTLERLQVDEYLLHHKDTCSLMARALAGNQSLQDLGFRCTTADFKQLARVFVPDTSGCQGNTSLLTLKLTFPKKTEVKDCMIVLGQLVGSNTTLKHVELCLELLNSRRREKERQWRIRGKLEHMLNNELRRNMCLQSLRVGAWRLGRVGAGGQWEMSFEGPCLGQKEYVVKVKM